MRPPSLSTFATVIVLLCCPVAPAAAATYHYRYGPIRVGGYGAIEHRPEVPHPHTTGFVTAMHAQVVSRSGKPVPAHRVMLHHAIFQSVRNRNKLVVCPGRDAEPFYGTAEEDETLRLPDGYGYRLRRHDRWRARWMLMNHTRFHHTVYIAYSVTVNHSPGLRVVRPLWLRALACGNGTFDVPGGGAPGSTFSRSRSWTAPFSGRIVAGGGHLHGGARSLVLSQPRCGGRTLFSAEPLYGLASNPLYTARVQLHEPGPIDVSGFVSRTGLPVVKGERLPLTANYDHQFAHPAVMATMHLYLAPDPRVAPACTPPPPDLRVLWAGLAGRRDPPRVR